MWKKPRARNESLCLAMVITYVSLPLDRNLTHCYAVISMRRTAEWHSRAGVAPFRSPVFVPWAGLGDAAQSRGATGGNGKDAEHHVRASGTECEASHDSTLDGLNLDLHCFPEAFHRREREDEARRRLPVEL